MKTIWKVRINGDEVDSEIFLIAYNTKYSYPNEEEKNEINESYNPSVESVENRCLDSTLDGFWEEAKEARSELTSLKRMFRLLESSTEPQKRIITVIQHNTSIARRRIFFSTLQSPLGSVSHEYK